MKAYAALRAVLVTLPGSTLGQVLENDDPSDTRDWGRTSMYQPQVNALGDIVIPQFPIPVVLGVALNDLDDNFHDPRGGGTRLHEGLDMMAPKGTPIASPTDAVVTRTGSGTNSGLYVRTANPGGEQFVYMHLDEIAHGIASGVTVKRGDVIGYVGNTGNASGGGAHLHFEVRKNGATDPLPRLTEVFSTAEKMAATQQAIERTKDAGRAAMLAKAYASEFRQAQAESIAVPQAILAHLAAPALTAGTLQPVPNSSVTHGAFIYGDTSADIRALQAALIAAPQGPSGERLKNTGATGYFGPLTKAALIEYQAAHGLPATGAVDSATHGKLFLASAPNPVIASGSAFARDLEVGMEGDDVRALQVFLNAHGFTIADSGVGSPGHETTYFGARTQAALARYQASYGISPSAGYFGPRTRAHVASR